MTGSATSLPHFPGSRYAAELGEKARSMKFPPELEREYHAFYLAERRSHVRSFNVIMLAIVVLSFAVSVFSAGDIVQHARIAAIACAYLVLIWASYSRYYDRVYLKAASGASVFIALVAAISVSRSSARRSSAVRRALYNWRTKRFTPRNRTAVIAS